MSKTLKDYYRTVRGTFGDLETGVVNNKLEELHRIVTRDNKILLNLSKRNIEPEKEFLILKAKNIEKYRKCLEDIKKGETQYQSVKPGLGVSTYM